MSSYRKHMFFLFAVIGHDSRKQPDESKYICKDDFPFSFCLIAMHCVACHDMFPILLLIKATVSRHEACLHVFYLFAVIGHDSSKQPDVFICKYDFPFSFSHRIVP